MINSGDLIHPKTIKFLCSYGGRILPRYPDGKLRYHGGETRVLSVDSSVSFSELLVKMGEMCGSHEVRLRCQLPTEDLDALVSIKSDEDLANLVEEYDRVAVPAQPIKIRAFLSVPKTTVKKVQSAARPTCLNSVSRTPAYAKAVRKVVGRGCKCNHHHHHQCGAGGYVYWVHHGKYWQ